ncbi:MAG: ABC transporter ATP-binding protein [bacterium]|nr:ABC transporter ATP-binding protein [bacterium]
MTDSAIKMSGLRVRFRDRGREVEALAGVDLEVRAGEVFGFIGPNGAGKTTAMMVLLGFVEPSAGSATVFGEDVRRRIARERIGYLAERAEAYPFLTGRELLDTAGRLFGLRGAALRERVDGLLERLGLAGAADRRIATYSRGMLQRAGLAQALVNDPDLLILDEPTGGMDPLGRVEVRGIIADLRRRGKTVFFSSHELSEIELVCDRIAIISRGAILSGGETRALVARAASLEKYFLELLGADSPGGGGR